MWLLFPPKTRRRGRTGEARGELHQPSEKVLCLVCCAHSEGATKHHCAHVTCDGVLPLKLGDFPNCWVLQMLFCHSSMWAKGVRNNRCVLFIVVLKDKSDLWKESRRLSSETPPKWGMYLDVCMNTIRSVRAVYFSGVKPANKKINESGECQGSSGQEEGTQPTWGIGWRLKTLLKF